MKNNLTCSTCGKPYKYTRSFGKHIDKEHPEIAREPMDLVFAFHSARTMQALNDEAEEFLKWSR